METPNSWRSVKLKYNKKRNITYIYANEEDFVPAYLKYLLESLNIPANTTIKFMGYGSKNNNNFIKIKFNGDKKPE